MATSETLRRLWNDPAYREKQRTSRVARANTPEGIAQRSAAAKKSNENWTPERRAKSSASRKGKGPKAVDPAIQAERNRVHAKRWRENNTEKCRAYTAEYNGRPEVKERKNARLRAFRKTEKFKQWKEKNLDQLREQSRKDAAKRRASIHGNLQNRVARAINSQLREGKRGIKVFDIVGYSAKQLADHIERQFTKGMTWQLFRAGKIHIDHILPVSSFVFSGPDCPELKACWALSNLRPMWKADNHKKGAKRVNLI